MMVNKSGDATWGCCCFVVSESDPTLADTDNKPKTVAEEETARQQMVTSPDALI